MPVAESTEAIQTACALLLGVCDGAHQHDGQGFNGWDANFIRDVWPRRGHWTAGQTFAVWKCLQKYRGQLGKMNFDLSTVPAPPNPKGPTTGQPIDGPKIPPKPQGVEIVVAANGIIEIRFPWKAETVEAIRNIPGRTWYNEEKVWRVQPEPQSIEQVIRFAKATDAQIPDQLITDFVAAQVAIQAAQAMANASMADSMAVDADFHVEGLGGTLMPFQRAGVKYAVNAKRCLIADEMGLGKTVQALAVLKHLNVMPALVICPASLRMNWMREARKWIPGCYSIPYEINPHSDVAVINYDIMAKWKTHIIEKIQRGKIKAIVFDEMHYLKNHKALRSVACREVATALRKQQGDQAVILGLTGTPVLNRPAELLNLLQILGRLDEVGGFKTFRDRYLMGDFHGRGANLEELQVMCRSRFLIRREKAQVLTDLPPKTRNNVDIPMADPAAYRAVEDAPLIENEAAAIVRLGELRRESARQKLPAIIEWVREFIDEGRKLVLFAVHQEIQAALMAEFPDAAHILGDDDQPSRQRAVDRFQEIPECRLIVCSLRAAGVGLTLTAASDVAFCELGWTPGDMDQAEDRCHRIGQRDSVTAWYLVTTGVDQSMMELIEEKREVSRQLLEHGRTTDVDQEQVKNRLVKAVLDKARAAGKLIKGDA
jgi:SNF2 family DNA or RNA helicase